MALMGDRHDHPDDGDHDVHDDAANEKASGGGRCGRPKFCLSRVTAATAQSVLAAAADKKKQKGALSVQQQHQQQQQQRKKRRRTSAADATDNHHNHHNNSNNSWSFDSLPIPSFDLELENLARAFDDDDDDDEQDADENNEKKKKATKELILGNDAGSGCFGPDRGSDDINNNNNNNNNDDDDDDDDLENDPLLRHEPIFLRKGSLTHTRQQTHHNTVIMGKEESYRSNETPVQQLQGREEDVPPTDTTIQQSSMLQQQQQEQPSPIVLREAVEAVFRETDLTNATVKNVIMAVQQRFHVGFTSETRQLIRIHLKLLMNQHAVVGQQQQQHQQQQAPKVIAAPSNLVQDTDNDAGKAVKQVPPNGIASLMGPAHKDNGIDRDNDDKVTTTEHMNNKGGTKRKIGGRNMSSLKRENDDDYARCDPSTAKQEQPSLKQNEESSSSVQPLVKKSKKLITVSRVEGRKTGKDENEGNAPAARRRTRRATSNTKPRKEKMGGCKLCENCPCFLLNDSRAEPSMMDLPSSDAAIERNLIKHLERMEKIAERYEDQTDAVRRQLKRHRRGMLKKLETACVKAGGDGSVRKDHKPRFLPDATELAQQLDHMQFMRKGLDPHTVRAASRVVFSWQPPALQQPTLTQLLGIRSKVNAKSANGTEGIVKDDDEEPYLYTIMEENEEEQEDVKSDAENVDPDAIIRSHGAMDPELHGGEMDVSCTTIPDAPVHRIQWTNGMEESKSDSAGGDGASYPGLLPRPTSLWGSHLRCRGGLHTASDRRWLDDDDYRLDCMLDDTGVQHLVDLFEERYSGNCNLDSEQQQQQPEGNNMPSQPSAVEMSMLSQRAQSLAEHMIQQIGADDPKASALQSGCPHWKENIFYALHQRDHDEVREALRSVEAEKARLQLAKWQLLSLLDRREAVLDLYEQSLRVSLERLTGTAPNSGKEPSTPHTVDVGRLDMPSEAISADLVDRVFSERMNPLELLLSVHSQASVEA